MYVQEEQLVQQILEHYVQEQNHPIQLKTLVVYNVEMDLKILLNNAKMGILQMEMVEAQLDKLKMIMDDQEELLHQVIHEFFVPQMGDHKQQISLAVR